MAENPASWKTKTVTIPWKTLEDIISAYLHGTRAFSGTQHIHEILIEKVNHPTVKANLTVYYGD